VLRIAAVGDGLVVPVFTIVGAGHSFGAILFKAGFTSRAGAAGIDHAANAHNIAFFESADLWPYCCNPADDFMARDNRVAGNAPIIGNKMNIGMAHPAVINLYGYVICAGRAAFDVMAVDTRRWRLGRKSFRLCH
jgi:hypothetical protein